MDEGHDVQGKEAVSCSEAERQGVEGKLKGGSANSKDLRNGASMVRADEKHSFDGPAHEEGARRSMGQSSPNSIPKRRGERSQRGA